MTAPQQPNQPYMPQGQPQQPYQQHPYQQQPHVVYVQQPAYQQAPMQGRDGAQYVRQQRPHSLLKHLLLCGVGIGFITIPMYSISKNHYWTA